MKKEIILMLFFTFVLSGCNPSKENNIVNLPDHIEDESQDEQAGDQNDVMELILIEEPGDLSEITSPVLVSGVAGPTFEQNIVVRLSDVEGNILSEKTTTILADVGKAGAFIVELEFEIAEDGYGRITVLDYSAMNGAVIHAASVPVTLLAEGTATINVNLDNSEVIDISTPEQGQELSSGEIIVTGTSEYFFESNLSMALCGTGGTGTVHMICGTEGNLLATSYAMIASPDIGIGGSFSGTITFSVTAETPAVLVVYAMSPMDGGIEHLSSVPVILLP